MNFVTWSALFNIVVCVGCGGFVLFQNPRGRKNILFAIFCLNLTFFSFFYVLWQLSLDAKTALFYVRALEMFAILLPVLFYHNTIVLVSSETSFHRRLLKWLYGFAAFLCLTNLTPKFVASVSPKMGFPFWPNPGPYFNLDNVNDLIPLATAIYLLWDFRRKSAPGLRNYIGGVLFTLIFGYLAIATNSFLWYDIPIYPFGTGGGGVVVGMLTYLFFKAGLFDMRIFLKDIVNYLLTCTVLGSILAVFIWFLLRDWIASVVFFSSPFFIPPLYDKLNQWIKKWIQKTWLAGPMTYLQSVDNTLEKIKETTYTYNDLARNIVNSILNTFPVQMAAVYFYEASTKQLILRAQRGMRNPEAGNLMFNRAALAIPESGPLMSHMQGKKDIVHREALLVGKDYSAAQGSVVQSMERIESEICAPFLLFGQVKGLLVLGKKKNNSAINEEDLEAVFAFARMGEEIMRYIIGMETELRNTALYSHDMHHDTRVLLQTFEFLQSPFSQNQPLEKIQRIFQQGESVAYHLNAIVETNRERSQLIMKSIRGEYEMIPVDIVPIVKNSCDKYLMQASKSKISLKMTSSLASCSVMGNSDDLARVFDNLINNALRYVLEGGEIHAQVDTNQDGVSIQVKDNGEGIDPLNLEKIWEMGWQDKGNSKKGTSGFGLSIVKQIIDLHHGTITAYSEGKGKGLVFTIKLPILGKP